MMPALKRATTRPPFMTKVAMASMVEFSIVTDPKAPPIMVVSKAAMVTPIRNTAPTVVAKMTSQKRWCAQRVVS